MGGPTAMLLLKNELTDREEKEIKEILETISIEVIKDEFWNWEFWVSNTSLISGMYEGEGRPFGLLIEAIGLDLEKLIILEKEFGFQPQQKMQIDAMCNSKEDHRILGELLLYFAQKYNAIIDFNGAVLPPTVSFSRHWNSSSWNEFADEFAFWVKDMPGKIYGLEYFTADDELWVSHKSDTEFFQFWLSHPYFHMIK